MRPSPLGVAPLELIRSRPADEADDADDERFVRVLARFADRGPSRWSSLCRSQGLHTRRRRYRLRWRAAPGDGNIRDLMEGSVGNGCGCMCSKVRAWSILFVSPCSMREKVSCEQARRGWVKKDGAAQVIRSEYGGQRAITYVRGNGSGHISCRGARPVDTKDISHGSFPFAIRPSRSQSGGVPLPRTVCNVGARLPSQMSGAVCCKHTEGSE